jgi:hypothetical protein
MLPIRPTPAGCRKRNGLRNWAPAGFPGLGRPPDECNYGANSRVDVIKDVSQMTSYVLLCRHGRHRDGRLIPTKLDDGTDEYPPAAVGNRLKECLESAPGTGVCLNLVGVRCAPTDEAAETLWHLQTALRLEATAKRGRPLRWCH